MTLRKILIEPNKLLRQVSKPVEKVGNQERLLMDDMLETMYEAPGIGLAAIQIGEPKRIIVMDISRDESKKEPLYLVNPVIKNKNSKKDVILVEALKSDGIKVSKKYKNLYKVSETEIPSDIQIFINNKDIATAMLRIVEVIGQDKIEDIDEDTLYFIISTLNQLDIDPLRNKILLKVLPLKV